MAVQKKFCEECGTPSEPNAIFCPNCGSKFPTTVDPLGEQSILQANSEPLSFQPTAAQPTTPPPSSEPITSIFEASAKFVRNPDKYSTQIMADKSVPSGLPLIILKSVLVGFVAYLQIALDDYFDVFNRVQYEAVSADTGFSVDELRGIYQSSLPIILGLLSLLYWYFGSWFMGKIISGGLLRDSPLTFDTTHSMRQLNAYRQIPIIIVQSIAIIMIYSLSPQNFLAIYWIINFLGQIVYALLLIRGLHQGTGYMGSFHKTFGTLIIILAILAII